MYRPDVSVVVDLPAFGPTTIDRVAVGIAADVSAFVTRPPSETVVIGLGLVDVDVTVPPVQAAANVTITTAHPRVNVPNRPR
jgi:hypothetical protein